MTEGDQVLRSAEILKELGLWREVWAEGEDGRAWFLAVLEHAGEAVESDSARELVAAALPFLFEDISYEAEAVRAHLMPDPLEAAKGVRGLRVRLEGIASPSWEAPAVARAVEAAAGDGPLDAGALSGLLRVALEGRVEGPSVYRAAELHGRERTLARLETLQAFLDHDPTVAQARRAAEGLVPPPK